MALDDVIQCELMWNDFTDVATSCRRICLFKGDRCICTPYISKLAVTSDCGKCHFVRTQELHRGGARRGGGGGGGTVTIIKFTKNKTGLFCSAKIVLTPSDLSKVYTYATVYTVTSTSQNPSGTSPYLLCSQAETTSKF